MCASNRCPLHFRRRLVRGATKMALPVNLLSIFSLNSTKISLSTGTSVCSEPGQCPTIVGGVRSTEPPGGLPTFAHCAQIRSVDKRIAQRRWQENLTENRKIVDITPCRFRVEIYRDFQNDLDLGLQHIGLSPTMG